MFFLMVCRHRPNCDEERDALRPLHREWVKSGGNGHASVVTGSALWGDDSRSTGNWGVLEADSMEAARAFAEGDPFAENGIVEEIELTRLPDTFAAERISPRFTQSD